MMTDPELKAELERLIQATSPLDLLLVLAEVLRERDMPEEADLVEKAANV